MQPIIWSDVNLHDDVAERLRLNVELRLVTDGSRRGLEDADAVIASGLLPADEAFFREAARLRVIARVGIGHERIDTTAATRHGVCVVNTPDAPTESTAEFTMALMLAVARRLTTAAAELGSGTWRQGPDLIGFDLAGRTLGLIGLGRIGRRVAEIATALRMRVIAFDPHASDWPTGIDRFGTLIDLLENADVISIHVPLTAETRQMINAQTLAACRPGAILVNAARGAIVDETALLEALNSGRLGGAGLDVWNPEPPSKSDPLTTHPRVVATPHIAAFTHEGRLRSHSAAATQVLDLLLHEKRPPWLVNPEVWPRRRGQYPILEPILPRSSDWSVQRTNSRPLKASEPGSG